MKQELVLANPAMIGNGREVFRNAGSGRQLKKLTTEDMIEACRRGSVHLNAKSINPESVDKAAKNIPFGDYSSFIYSAAEIEKERVVQAVEQFLNGSYPSVIEAGVSCSIRGGIDQKQEDAKISTLVKRFQGIGMTGQSTSIKEEYSKLKGARECFRIMHDNNVLSADSVLPIEYLPEIIMAVPVWYLNSRLRQSRNKNMHAALSYLVDQLPNQQSANLFQIYNPEYRGITKFAGRDILPAYLAEVIEKAKDTFDLLAIATPYHDVATRFWTEAPSVRNVDPFLLGFMEGLPFIFLLGRWSGSGLFPLYLDMVADTADHLRLLSTSMKSIRNDAGVWWIEKQKGVVWSGRQIVADAISGIINAFDENKLFETLRARQ